MRRMRPQFGDEGANTLGAYRRPHAPAPAQHGMLWDLGLAAQAAGGTNPFPDAKIIGRWGHAQEVSEGKDTITGHWEIAGVPVPFKWHYYPAHQSRLSARPDRHDRATLQSAGPSGAQPCLGHAGDRGLWRRAPLAAASPSSTPAPTASSRLRPMNSISACNGSMMCARWRAN